MMSHYFNDIEDGEEFVIALQGGPYNANQFVVTKDDMPHRGVPLVPEELVPENVRPGTITFYKKSGWHESGVFVYLFHEIPNNVRFEQ